ncbi:MAG: hypothetical protein L3J03_04215 [Desulfobacterales bacterium]|nr:hypothetical protein [Desulfobacterales bacterium]
MKKVLATVAALGLIAGVASTASALDLSVKGYYKLEGKMLSDASTTAGGVAFVTNNSEGTNSWWQHDFRIYPTLTVNDHIKVMADVRLVSTSNGVANTAGMWGNSMTTNNITANKIYMEYMSPIGKIRMGTTPAGAWGSPYLNNAGAGHRLMWWPNFLGDSPVSLLFFTQKMVEADGGVAGTGATVDQDTDAYYAGIGYKADMGKFDMAYFHVRNGATGLDGQNLWFNASATVGAVNLLGELAHSFGDATATTSMDTWAGMALVSGQVADNVTAGAVYFFATGEDSGTDTTAALGGNGTGFNWQPLYIITGPDMGVFNGDSVRTPAVLQAAGLQAFGAFVDVAVTPQLTLHGAIGTGNADNMDTMAAGQSDDYGWEYNVGASYKLLDNLTYDLHLGYWAVGDFVKGMGTPNDITLVTNSLTMKF